MKNIAIIGSGSWGVALAIHLVKTGNNVKVWSMMQDEADLINNERKCKFLPNIKVPEEIICTTSYEEAIKGSDYIFHVTPSKFTRENFVKYKQYITNQPVIICSKGLEKGTNYTLDEVLKEEMPNVRIGALSGPSHAEEVSIGLPTVLTIASEEDEIINDIIEMFKCEAMRIYISKDVKGVELGRCIKKYYSIL